MQVVLISGLSGSGKSIALNVLEDSGYYCVDNLPAPLLSDLVAHLRAEGHALVAVAVDMRGGASIAALPPQLRKLEAERVTLRFVFLDARDEVLIQRFSETRRRHPLAGDDVTLEEAIAREREALEMLVGAEDAVELHAKAAADLHLAPIVMPRHAEDELPLGLADALDDLVLGVLRVLREHRRERFDHFLDRLVKLRLAGVAADDLPVNAFDACCVRHPLLHWIGKRA